MTVSEVARKFVEKINAHDTEGLVSLMTADHVFIDSLGKKVERLQSRLDGRTTSKWFPITGLS